MYSFYAISSRRFYDAKAGLEWGTNLLSTRSVELDWLHSDCEPA